MDKFDIANYSNKNAYNNFMIKTLTTETSLVERPLFGRKGTAEAKRAEMESKVSAFVKSAKARGFITTAADRDRANRLVAMSKVSASPILHPKLVLGAVTATTVAAALTLVAVDHFMYEGVNRQTAVTSITTNGQKVYDSVAASDVAQKALTHLNSAKDYAAASYNDARQYVVDSKAATVVTENLEAAKGYVADNYNSAHAYVAESKVATVVTENLEAAKGYVADNYNSAHAYVAESKVATVVTENLEAAKGYVADSYKKASEFSPTESMTNGFKYTKESLSDVSNFVGDKVARTWDYFSSLSNAWTYETNATNATVTNATNTTVTNTTDGLLDAVNNTVSNATKGTSEIVKGLKKAVTLVCPANICPNNASYTPAWMNV